MIDYFLSGFLVITGSVLKFVTQGQHQQQTQRKHPVMQGHQAARLKVLMQQHPVHHQDHQPASLQLQIILSPLQVHNQLILLFGQRTYQMLNGLNLCAEGLLRLCQISLSLRQMEEVFIVDCPTGHLQMETR